MYTGVFITFEGGEGCGKTTQAAELCSFLKKKNIKTVLTREPGGTHFAESIREILLDPANRITPLAELMLYEAARAQHAADVIRPALESGTVVICDRFFDATIAYQGYGRGLPLPVIRRLNAIAALGLKPDLTIYLDIPVETGLARAKSITKGSYSAGDRIEREESTFHERVRRGYLALAKKEPRRIKVFPPDTIEETHRRITEAVLPFLKKRRITGR